jgi:hypothetical protein
LDIAFIIRKMRFYTDHLILSEWSEVKVMVSCRTRKAHSVFVVKHLLFKDRERGLRIILKWISGKQVVRIWIGSNINYTLTFYCQRNVCRSWNRKARPVSTEKKDEERVRYVKDNRQQNISYFLYVKVDAVGSTCGEMRHERDVNVYSYNFVRRT